jgi:hypothetical protein
VTRGKLACTACHRGIETSEKITAEVRVEMDACVACHAERGVVATGGGDVVPPASPTGLKAVPVPEEAGAIALSWTKSMNNETKEEALVYLVYWSATSPVPTTGAPAATVTGGTTCKLTGLPRNKDCYFRVIAQDAAGNRSRLRNEGPAPASGRETDACAVCHKQIRTDQKPPSHQLAWTRLHGDTVRNAGSKIENRCRLCHTEASCSTCHREQAPANHTGFWRYRGHGVAVDTNRSSCAVCHRSDFCDRCHRETAPQSHTGSWGGTKNRHCLSCHLSGGLVRPCSLCHNHVVHNAPPIPGDPQHAGVPPTLCRSCHSIVQMQHADNGESCVLCHK